MNRVGLVVVAFVSFTLAGVPIVLGTSLLPSGAEASEAGTFGPWLFTWMLIWMTTISGAVLGVHLLSWKSQRAHALLAESKAPARH
jgi:hypothetical protein